VPADARGAPRGLYGGVAALALLTNALGLLSTRLWVYPDSVDYIQLGGGIADRFDIGNELFLVRTPGYPVFLAVTFRLFGSGSPAAILVVQHALAVATAVLTAAIAWRLTERRAVAFLAGVLIACSLQTLAYANLVLTETPFALTLIACLYALIRFDESGRSRWLVAASLLAGLGYLLRPVSLYLLPVCAAAGLWQAWRAAGFQAARTFDREGTRRVFPRNQFRRGARAEARGSAVGLVPLPALFRNTALSLAPALAVAAPWMLVSAATQKSLQATRCLDYMYYLRASTFDRLDSTQSAAMRDIHTVVEEAQRAGHLSADADFHDRTTVIKAYKDVRGWSFARSSAILGQAGRDLMREHPWETVVGTLKYAAWMLLSPDPVYRFHPGGSPGVNGRRAAEAETYDIGTYAFGDGSWERVLSDYRHYLPLTAEPTPLTGAGRELAVQYYRHIDQGASLGIGDSPFEVWAVLGLLGGAGSLFCRRRAAWMTILAAVALHVLVSAFFSGPQTRYALPVKPLLCLYTALAIVGAALAATTLVRRIFKILDAYASKTSPAAQIVVVVLLIASAVEVLALSASHLWIVPTSLEYLELAKELVGQWDFSNELFLLRTPAYPLLLAVGFSVFGSESGTVLFILQHAMTVLTAGLTALIGWQVTARQNVALIAGLMAACSLQVIAFANQLMTETPYMLALVASVYFLVKYHSVGRLRDLACSSALAGIAYLFRPIGLTLAAVLGCVAICHAWKPPRRSEPRPAGSGVEYDRRHQRRLLPLPGPILPLRALRPSAPALFCAFAPMALFVVPWWIHNQAMHGANSFGRCFDFALYNRAANVERSNGAANEQLARAQAVVEKAKSEGRIDADADAGMAWTVWQANRSVHGASLKDSSELLGQAARRKLLDDPAGILWGTVKYSAWMLLTPDSSYRYHPDGTAGVAGRRPEGEEIFDSALYLDPLARPLKPFEQYLALDRGPTPTTALWSTINRWFVRHVEHGAPIIGVGDSLYEEMILFCLAGGVLCLFTRNRRAWVIVLAVLVLQIVPSAFVAGVGPRYAMPVQPLLKLFAAFLIVACGEALAHGIRRARTVSGAATRLGRSLALPNAPTT
jgi:hypothetical protein